MTNLLATQFIFSLFSDGTLEQKNDSSASLDFIANDYNFINVSVKNEAQNAAFKDLAIFTI